MAYKQEENVPLVFMEQCGAERSSGKVYLYLSMQLEKLEHKSED